MNPKDTPWSGLLKIPEETVIAELRKELSHAKVEIGQLKSYIDELESGKRPLRKVMTDYYDSHLRIYERVLLNADSCRKGIVKRNRILTERYLNLLRRYSDTTRECPILLKRSKANELLDLMLAGIQYAVDNNAYSSEMKRLYKDIKEQLK